MSGPILVTGATGLLGGMCLWRWRGETGGLAALVREPRALPAGAWPGVRVVAADLARPESLAAAVRAVGPELVVHCAALTKVDQCQHQPELARALNTRASGALAAAAREQGAGFVYVSTDAVYAEGPGPHPEGDARGRLSVYARSKLEGEEAAAQAHPQALILRTCLIGWNQDPERSSLAEWIAATLRAGQEVPGFTDVRFSPLFTGTLARLMLRAARAGLGGVYNLGSRDGMSKYQTARLIAEGLGLDPELVRPTSQSQGNLAVPRPQDPVMDSRRIYAALAEEPPPLAREVEAMLEMEASGELAEFRRFGGYA